MEIGLKIRLKEILSGILNSYSQVFFSENKLFAVVLLLVTFIDYNAGICGIISVIVSNILALSLGYSKPNIKKGLYGFNSLLVGLGLGIIYSPSIYLYLIIVLGAIFTFFISISLEGVIGKYTLPFLSIPFLLSIWFITLSARNFHALEISARGIYTYNELYTFGGSTFVKIYEWWNNANIPEIIRVYFISLGAIFFQINVFAGILISIGLLYYSRIAFSLSVVGFFVAFCFYRILGANITELGYSYIGFNYILTSIAVGGFFLIPSWKSYAWTIVLIPVVAFVTISLSVVFATFQLSIYSLPFNLIVLLFLYILKLRVTKKGKVLEVSIQQNTPEKNLYYHNNDFQRFGNKQFVEIALPFFGVWKVSQSHDGEYTHQDRWRHAWDFIITDGYSDTQFSGNGDDLESYYCYNKIIIAPGKGEVIEIIDGIEDNEIGKVNLKDNWGNTVIIKHSEFLYSKLCHIKKGSFKIAKGDVVKQGDIIAHVGNSGRSPYPHLHFQLQATPYIGSETIEYPINHYVKNTSSREYELRSFAIPNENDRVSNIETNKLLQKAFDFIPGMKFNLNNKGNEIKWEVHSNIYNQTYIYCSSTESILYFHNDGKVIYFTHFDGDKSSLLFTFYMSFYKVQLGFYKDMKLNDLYPVNMVFPKFILFFQDFIAPFYLFIKGEYIIHYSKIDNEMSPSEIILNSRALMSIFNKKYKEKKFEIFIDSTGISKIKCEEYNNIKEFSCFVE